MSFALYGSGVDDNMTFAPPGDRRMWLSSWLPVCVTLLPRSIKGEHRMRIELPQAQYWQHIALCLAYLTAKVRLSTLGAPAPVIARSTHSERMPDSAGDEGRRAQRGVSLNGHPIGSQIHQAPPQRRVRPGFL
jgi:hypothetical protein